MKFIFGLFLLIVMNYGDNVYVLSQNIVCNFSTICKAHMLNGHYIVWPNKKTETDYLQKKLFIPKNIVFTRFQICGNQVFLISPRYR